MHQAAPRLGLARPVALILSLAFALMLSVGLYGQLAHAASPSDQWPPEAPDGEATAGSA